MFGSLFRRAEATVDNAVGDIGNRIVVTIPFLIAAGFLAASLTVMFNRLYGPEIGLLAVAGVFVVVGGLVAIVIKVRSSRPTVPAAPPPEPEPIPEPSMFDENIMAILSSAAPVVLPAALRVLGRNWPLILAALAGVYVFGQSNTNPAAGTGRPQSKPF